MGKITDQKPSIANGMDPSVVANKVSKTSYTTISTLSITVEETQRRTNTIASIQVLESKLPGLEEKLVVARNEYAKMERLYPKDGCDAKTEAWDAFVNATNEVNGTKQQLTRLKASLGDPLSNTIIPLLNAFNSTPGHKSLPASASPSTAPVNGSSFG